MVFCFGDAPFEVPDVTGKVALVTGANAGMGYVIAEHLALNGAKVWMGARSEERAKQAIERFNTEHKKIARKGEIIWLPLDLTSPTDVMTSVKTFLSQEKRLDILVNNAARMASPYVITKDGLETSVAIKYNTPFYL